MNNEHENIMEEIRQLTTLRDLMDERIQSLRFRMITPTTVNGNNSQVVYTKDLRPYIQQWIDGHNTLTTLADKAGISEETLQRVLSGKHETVKMRTADKILTALELPHIYNQLVPEPPESKYWED